MSEFSLSFISFSSFSNFSISFLTTTFIFLSFSQWLIHQKPENRRTQLPLVKQQKVSLYYKYALFHSSLYHEIQPKNLRWTSWAHKIVWFIDFWDPVSVSRSYHFPLRKIFLSISRYLNPRISSISIWTLWYCLNQQKRE